MRFLKVIFATAIVILGIVFIIQNLEVLKQPVQVELNLAVFSFKSPAVHLWGLILFAFFLGVFTASLYGLYELYKQRRTIRQLKHNLDILGQELQQASGASPAAPAPAPAPPPSQPTE
jgi:uncharacterized integral membrane protein